MQSWNMDPKKGDYVMTGGQPQQTNSLQVPAYFRLKIKRQQWLYAPEANYGSDYFTLKRRPSDNANERLESIGVAALQPLVDDGRATNVTVDVVLNRRFASGLQVKITDASGNVEVETFQGLGS